MVAISLYRGNLHRVPDVPRRWLAPKRQISLKDFKTLLSRRSRALSRLNYPSSSNPNPNPNPNLVSDNEEEEEVPKVNLDPETKPKPEPESEPEILAVDCGEGPSGEKNEVEEEDSKLDVKPIVESISVADRKSDLPEGCSDHVDDDDEKLPVVAAEVLNVEEQDIPNPEIDKKDELLDEKLRRKKEVEEKLQVLNDKKHGLVQLLKQVSNAEEELKRRIAAQGITVRPPALLQVDPTTTVDSVSMTRISTPRMMGSVPNPGGDHEAAGGEGEALSNQNLHSSRQLFRMNSPSPSSESPIRKLPHQHNSGLNPTSRTSLGPTGSPSPLGQQGGHAANAPTVSVSGTNYVASSPSPAASGGTSTFRDTRLPSPWN